MTFSPSEMKLAGFFVEREGEGVLEVLKTANLVGEGLLDSLDMVALAVYIEEQFGKKIDVISDETLNAMQSFDELHTLATS